MNKITKGAIATGAGIILLMGGAGTFALWNDSASVSGGSIESGTLSIDQDGSGSWSDVSVPLSPVSIDIEDFLVVPGDVLTFTQDFTVQATGDNLEATLDVDDSSINWGTWATNGAIANVSVNGGDASIDDGDDGDTVTVTVTFTFPYTAGNQNLAQGESVDLSDLEITLTQDAR